MNLLNRSRRLGYLNNKHDLKVIQNISLTKINLFPPLLSKYSILTIKNGVFLKEWAHIDSCLLMFMNEYIDFCYCI